jgi:hypothetical protein
MKNKNIVYNIEYLNKKRKSFYYKRKILYKIKK